MKIYPVKYRDLSFKVTQLSLILLLLGAVIIPNDVFGSSEKMKKYIQLTREELMAMPRWCQNRMLVQRQVVGLSGKAFTNVPDSVMREYKKWTKVIGEDISRYTHHYCEALNWINRYKRFYYSRYEGAERDRQYALNSAINNFRFMRGHLKPKHKLYYSMLMREAYVFLEQKKYLAAGNSYKRIIKLRPGYAPAYIGYARLLKSIGKSADAMKVLQVGLKNTKGAKSIMNERAAMEAGEGKE